MGSGLILPRHSRVFTGHGPVHGMEFPAQWCGSWRATLNLGIVYLTYRDSKGKAGARQAGTRKRNKKGRPALKRGDVLLVTRRRRKSWLRVVGVVSAQR